MRHMAVTKKPNKKVAVATKAIPATAGEWTSLGVNTFWGDLSPTATKGIVNKLKGLGYDAKATIKKDRLKSKYTIEVFVRAVVDRGLLAEIKKEGIRTWLIEHKGLSTELSREGLEMEKDREKEASQEKRAISRLDAVAAKLGNTKVYVIPTDSDTYRRDSVWLIKADSPEEARDRLRNLIKQSGTDDVIKGKSVTLSAWISTPSDSRESLLYRVNKGHITKASTGKLVRVEEE